MPAKAFLEVGDMLLSTDDHEYITWAMVTSVDGLRCGIAFMTGQGEFEIEQGWTRYRHRWASPTGRWIVVSVHD